MKDENVSAFEVPSQTSLTLLDRVKKNEGDAWSRLVDLYAPLIYARCRQHWKLPPADAENIGQDVFAAVSRKIGEFQRSRTGSFRRWLRVITDNKCKDDLRCRDPVRSAGGTAARDLLENVAEETLNQDETTQEVACRAVVMRQALKVVDNEFSQRDLQIFWKIAVDDRYRQDVAEEYGISSNTVYIIISRIRKRLREIFEDLIDDDLLEDSSPP